MTRVTRLVLAADAYLPWSGGSRVYYHNLYAGLAARHGYHVTVLTSHTPGDAAFDARTVSANFQIRRDGAALPDWNYQRAPQAARHLLRAAGAARSLAPEAWHCGDLVPQAAGAWLLRRVTGRPYLVFVHGDEISQTDRRRHQPKLRDSIYRDASMLIAANPFAMAKLGGILGTTERCRLLTPGVDPAHFFARPAPELRRKLRRFENGPVLLTAARLVKRKGVDTVLHSLPAILRRFPTLTCVVAGSGPERPALDALAKTLGIERHVLFTGDIPHAELGEYYRAADLLVLANREHEGDIESFGLVFLEANACGKPVVGGRSGGVPDAVIDDATGLLAEPDDPASFARAALRLLENPEAAARMGEAGAKRAREHFRWEARVDALHQITQAGLR